MYCKNCGAEINEGFSYCINCGTKIDDSKSEDKLGDTQEFEIPQMDFNNKAYYEDFYHSYDEDSSSKKEKPSKIHLKGAVFILCGVLIGGLLSTAVWAYRDIYTSKDNSIATINADNSNSQGEDKSEDEDKSQDENKSDNDIKNDKKLVENSSSNSQKNIQDEGKTDKQDQDKSDKQDKDKSHETKSSNDMEDENSLKDDKNPNNIPSGGQVDYSDYSLGDGKINFQYPSFFTVESKSNNHVNLKTDNSDAKISITRNNKLEKGNRSAEEKYNSTLDKLKLEHAQIGFSNLAKRESVVTWIKDGKAYYQCNRFDNKGTKSDSMLISYPVDQEEYYYDIIQYIYDNFQTSSDLQ